MYPNPNPKFYLKTKRAFCAALAATLLFTGCHKPVERGEREYFLSGSVTRIELNADGSQLVSITASDGNIYTIIGYDFRINDRCGLFMGDNGTDTPNDDIVYDAWVTAIIAN